MLKYYDLHIHTSLSPCADLLMSPNNILNMSALKELNIIGVTDHNTIGQLINFDYLENSYDIIVIPGIEVQTIENYHVLCYFSNYADAYLFGNELKKYYLLENNIEIGNSEYFDYYDEVTCFSDINFNMSVNLNIIELSEIINKYDAALVLAHIERYYNKAINMLEQTGNQIFKTIEINAKFDISKIKNYDFLNNNYKIIRNSDAHNLEDINEKEYQIQLKKLNKKHIIEVLRGV